MNSETAPGDIGPLLERLGRASTPPVNVTAFPIDLGEISGAYTVTPEADPSTGSIWRPLMFVGGQALRQRLLERFSLVNTMPFLSLQQLERRECTDLVIDTAAFVHGPWTAAHHIAKQPLLEELVELSVKIRRNGALSYLVRHSPEPMKGTARLESVSSIIVPVDEATTSLEGAPPSALLDLLRTFFHEERGRI